MTILSKQSQSTPSASASWKSDAVQEFEDLCLSEGLNPVRLRRLLDECAAAKRTPSRQGLIDALKCRPRIKERATVLASITKKLTLFMESYTQQP